MFEEGDYVIYELIKPNDGRKYICRVIGTNSDGWVIDANGGTCFSSSFRPQDIIIHEHGKKRKQKGKT